MESFSVAKKPHAVCIPFPFQSHINVMFKLAKVLHTKGFHITFVNTEFNHHRVLLSRGPDSFQGLPDDFRFETIPDGLPPSDLNATSQHPLALTESIAENGLGYVRSLIGRLNEESSKSSAYPRVSCLVTDFIMSGILDAADELGIPKVLLWPMSATVLDFFHHRHLLDKAFLKLKDNKSNTANDYLDTPIDFIPGVGHMRLKDVPTFFWDGVNDRLLTVVTREMEKYTKASAIVVNTYDALEREVLDVMKSIPPAIYPIGPLQLLEEEVPNEQLRNFGNNLLKENTDCLEWLDSQKPNSVVYVSFGTTAVMTNDHLIEFAWGLANCKHPFLWVISPDLIIGEAAILPPEFVKETADRAMISGWCPQEEVLCHSSTGGFLTHSGWSSSMDTISAGVPIISWPTFGDQVTNCRNACVRWGTGLDIDMNVTREKVEKMVRELMEGEKGKEMKKKAMEWKKSAQESIKPGGSSYNNLDKVIQEVLLLH